MFAGSLSEVIPRTREVPGAKKNMIRVFFTARELIILDVLPTGSKFNQAYFINYFFSGFEKLKPEFSLPDATVEFLGAQGEFNIPQWIKMVSKFEKDHFS
jgi:hypothetical protein